MSIRSILVPLLSYEQPVAPLNAAWQLARRFGAHLDALFIRPDPAEVFTAMPNFAIAERVTMADLEEDGRQIALAARERFDNWCAACALGVREAERGPAASWHEHVGPVETGVIDRGRLSDLIVERFPEPHEPHALFAATAFATGRPVLLVRSEPPADLLRRVLVAWNGGLDATRAVAAAMPLLEAAGHVTVFTAPGHGGELYCHPGLCDALHRHGIHAEQTWGHQRDPEAGEAILSAAAERNASLIVMGATPRSRIERLLFGGATRHVLRASSLPVLLAH